jgi:ribonucleoside-triphosphate reductase
MTAAALSAYKFAASYGRYLPDLRRREVPAEAFRRVVEMHRVKYARIDLNAELDEVLAAMDDNLVLGSQRGLQFGGRPILRKNARLYNCTTSYCDRPRFFQECLYLLLCGCGTGFSVQRHHVARLPDMIAVDPGQQRTFVIPDTVEGWADALGVLLASYGIVDGSMATFAPETVPGDDTDIAFIPGGYFKDYRGSFVCFDYSRIRPKGAELSTGAGKAPGPGPLMASLEHIRKVLDRVAATAAKAGVAPRLRPIDCYDIVMHASDAVLAGGVRRSATICLFSPDDHDMMTAKTGNWMEENPQRGRSNNSAVLLRDSTSWEDFHDIFMLARRQYGEPGFVWADSTEITYNPCVEIGLYPAISNADFIQLASPDPLVGGKPIEHVRNMCAWGDIDPDATKSGWAFCNLCEINAKACDTHEKWRRAARAAAILGTLQAGYTDFSYLGPVSEAIAKREALLGVSMTGMMDNPAMAFDPELQRELAALILEVNEVVALKLGIRPTARATCVKPAGSTSCILGTSSGIHAQHAKRYFRRAQANDNEAPLQYFALHNPGAVEKSVWNPNGTDVVVTFCVEAAEEALTRNEVSGLKQLEYVKLTQENWVAAGKVADRCAQPWLRHNVSNTITIRAAEQEEACRYIFDNREAFAGISILDESGDLDYPQAPFCEVRTEEELLDRYGRGVFFASGLIVDGLHAFGNNLWHACATALGDGEAAVLANGVPYPAPRDRLPGEIVRAYERVHEAKKDWVRRARQFAERYFGFDTRAEELILSEIHNTGRATPKSATLPAEAERMSTLFRRLEEVRKPLRRMTYCLKEVNNLKLWADLTRSWAEVDYTLMVEERDGTSSVLAEQACGGQGCLLTLA